MDPKRWKQIDSLVDQALDVPVPEQAAFVAGKANGDADLERAVLELVAAQGQSDEFLQHSAMKIVAKAIAYEQPPVKPVSLKGKKIATYRIEKLLGAGGMGQVYLAFDEKLKRNVALKILPAEYGSNDERVKRFELEARAISSINHPNIVTIYDVGNFEGINYIATEFVEGNTLRELTAGQFKLRNVIANSIQICDALSAAHAEGIIHRDIKPENIMIRLDGYSKILDFGVAKLTEPGGDTMGGNANTMKGMIIGTPAYMSPAQVSGESIDHRTDIWSAGVVLYEFVSGTNPFRGANRQATFQAILSSAPPRLSELRPDIPDELDRIVAKILDKDVDLGYQTAADLRADLKRIKRELDTSPSGSYSGQTAPTSITDGRSHRRWLAAGSAIIVIMLAIVSWWAFSGGVSEHGPDWSAARNVALTDQPGVEYYPSLAPDGRSFVYASDQRGNFDIFVQRVAGKNAQNLTSDSTANDTQPAISPSAEQIAFRSEREPSGIYVMAASGENPKLVSDVGYHPSWSPDGGQLVIAGFGRDQPTVRAAADQRFLAIVDVATGHRRQLLDVEASFPTWSPNGSRIAYWFYTETYGRREIATVPAAGGEPVVAVSSDFAVSNWNPVWSPDGHFLYFVSNKGGSLNFWRVRIDESSGTVLGEPEPVVTPSKFSRHLNFSRDGKRMIYVATNNRGNIQGAEWDDRDGKIVGAPYWITEGDREMVRPELSPDGTRFALRLNRRTQDDIVTVSRDGLEWRDVTNDAPFDRYVRWSPDGRQLAFNSDRDGGQVWASNADGTNLHQITFPGPEDSAYAFPIWSPDGKRMIVGRDGQPFIIDTDKSWQDQTPQPLPLSEGVKRFTTWDWSRDGKLLAGIIATGDTHYLGYYSFDTGMFTTITEGSELIPTFKPDGQSLLYGINNKIYLVDLKTQKTRELFTSPTQQLRSPFISSDKKLIYYTAHSAESDIWLLDLSDSP